MPKNTNSYHVIVFTQFFLRFKFPKVVEGEIVIGQFPPTEEPKIVFAVCPTYTAIPGTWFIRAGSNPFSAVVTKLIYLTVPGYPGPLTVCSG